MRTATEADGLFYTYLSFPPGTDLPSNDDDAGPSIRLTDPNANIER